MKVAVCSKSFSKNKILRQELLSYFPEAKFNDEGKDLKGHSLIEFLSGIEGAIIGLEKVDEDLLKALPQLKAIGKYGVGTDAIDFGALKKYQIRFGYTAGVNRRSVAELALGHMICCLRHLMTLNQEIKSGVWQVKFGGLITGRTVGIIGFGNVGQDLASLLRPFGCRLLAYDIVSKEPEAQQFGVQLVSLETLLKESDIVSLHVPLDSTTRGMMDKRKFLGMKAGAILINTARGNIVDQNALREVLVQGHLAAAAFDVFDIEPPVDMDLIQLPQFYASPHIGGSSVEAVLAMGRAAIEGLRFPKELV